MKLATTAALFAALVSTVAAATAPCAVVWDDRGAAGAAKFSKSRAENAVSLLARGGIRAPLFPLSRLAEALAEPCRVLHLVLPDAATAADGAALSKFAGRGGKVVVHGSYSPVVAEFFGLQKPSAASSAPRRGGAWTGYALADPRPLNSPPFVANGVKKVPSHRGAEGRGVSVTARWRDESGGAGPAAILRSPAGFWMSRVLYDDGPADERVELLVALTCALHAPLWRDSTLGVERAAWNEATRGSASFADASRAVSKAAPGARRVLVQTLLDAAEARLGAAEALCRRGLYGAARTNALVMARNLSLAVAAARPLGPDRKGRPLAVWAPSVRPPGGAGNWAKAARSLARAGVSDVLLHAGSLASCATPMPGVPRDPGSARGGADPFAEAVEACHAAGIRVHAWVRALDFEGAPEKRFETFSKSRRLLHRKNGEALDWLDPAVAANGDELAKAVAALAARTGIDGVNLDFVRYPDAETREKRSPAAVEGVVRKVRAALRAAAPRCELSASVYGGYPACVAGVGQDWQKWIDAGLVDKAVPMNYSRTEAGLAELAGKQKRNRKKLVCGIGASARESWLSPLETVAQLRAAYRAGFAGAAVYALDDRFCSEFVPVLELAR